MAIAMSRRPLHKQPFPQDGSLALQHLWRSCKSAADVVAELEETQRALPLADKVQIGWLIDRAYEELLAIERYAEGVK